MADVHFVNVPGYDELSVKGLYTTAVSQDGMSFYFPDKFPKGKQCDRSYLFNVWNSIHPNQIKELIDHANK